MNNIDDIYNALNMLSIIIKNSKDVKEKYLAVGKFDDMIFLHEDTIVNEEIDDMLVDLAHNLEYYHPDPDDKNNPSGFFGDKEFFEKVNPVLEKLRIEMEGGNYEKTQ